MVTKPIDGEPAHHANGGTIGFTLENEAAVDTWHKAGAENGGQSIEDPPGPRQGAAGPLYLAYLRDPDGNKLCGLYRMPS
jgi:catechol 2,3-dioxygenase-like lactoylglutathione lyase family enzyme